MPDPTWAFNLNWTNNYPLYWAVLGFSASVLARTPSISDADLGAAVRQAVEQWCDDGHVRLHGVRGAVPSAVLRVLADDVRDFSAVDPATVGVEVRDVLQSEGVDGPGYRLPKGPIEGAAP